MDRTTRALGTLTLAMTFAFALDLTPVEASRQSRQGRELTLAWFSGRLGYPVHFETMAREVDRLFEPIGVEVSWEPATSVDTLKVILLPIEPSLWNLPPSTMGVYLGDDGVQDRRWPPREKRRRPSNPRSISCVFMLTSCVSVLVSSGRR